MANVISRFIENLHHESLNLIPFVRINVNVELYLNTMRIEKS